MKMEKFSLEVDLGNEEMQTPEQVATLLRKLAGRIESGQLNFKWADKVLLWDDNGNTVGQAWTWNVY